MIDKKIEDNSIFKKQFKKAIKWNMTNKFELARDLNLQIRYIEGLMTGEIYPTMTMIINIANELNSTPEYLLTDTSCEVIKGLSPEDNSKAQSMDDMKREVFCNYCFMTKLNAICKDNEIGRAHV